ncbi:MAG: hypothetical protein JWP87_1542 [Labilithrix sp.]|nr:hypothetical protein [Labilithrix sp.]
MNWNQARPPLARTSSSAIRSSAGFVAVNAPPAPPAVILYSLPGDVAAECERVASELRLARAEVKHLQAACVALKAHPRAILVASSAIRSWDREVVEEHASRAGTPLRWVDANHTPDDVASEVRSWATDTIRRARAMSR